MNTVSAIGSDPTVAYADDAKIIHIPADMMAAQGGPVRAAGSLYRYTRSGQKLTAVVANNEALSRIAEACERIGLPFSTLPDTASDLHILVGKTAASLSASRGGERAPLRIVLAGYGVVGQALVERIRDEPDFQIVSVLVRNLAGKRRVTPPVAVTADVEAFRNCDADVVIDLLSCEDLGLKLSETFLDRGVNVVSASKRVIGKSGRQLRAIADSHAADLRYSAAVGGGAPVLETIARARDSGRVAHVEGILNGTVNYVLDQLHKGASYDDALAAARKAGFAEEDCTFDLSGADAADKCRLIAAHSFDVDPASVDVTFSGLTPDLARTISACKRRYVQLSRVDRQSATVEIVPASYAGSLGDLHDEWNGAVVSLDNGHRLRCIGRGAGGAATAEAVTADLFDILDKYPSGASAEKPL